MRDATTNTCFTPAVICNAPQVRDATTNTCVTPAPTTPTCTNGQVLNSTKTACDTIINIPVDNEFAYIGISTPKSHSSNGETCSSWQVIPAGNYTRGVPVKLSICSYVDGGSGYTVVENNGSNADVCSTVFFNDGKQSSGCYTGMPAGKVSRASCYSCGTKNGGAKSIQLTKYTVK